MEILFDIFKKLLEMSIQASIAIIIVLLMRALFNLIKVPKKFAYFLWIIPFIRLVCPFFLESSVGVIPKNIVDYDGRSHEVSQDVSSDVDIAEPIYTDIHEVHTPVLNHIKEEYYTYQVDKILTETDTEEPQIIKEKETTKKIEADKILALFWLMGVCSIFVYSITSLIRFKRNLIGSVHIYDEVYENDYVDTAFVLGLIKPRIYVPSGINEEELKYVVAHERLHIKRMDYLIKPLAYFIVTFHWFNPLCHLAYFLMEKDMEMACDEAVLGDIGYENRAEYASALLKISTGRRFVPSMPTAFAEGETKGRVKNIMKVKKPVMIVLVVAIILVTILSVVLLTNPKDKKEDKSSESTENVTDKYELSSGTYYMQVDENDKIDGSVYKFVPRVSINEDGTVAFAYDPLNSYYPYAHGGYTVEDGVLSFTTEGGRCFNFQIVDDDTIAFLSSESYDVSVVDENCAYPVVDGSEFVLIDEDEVESKEMEYLFYSSIKEVDYGLALIDENMPLGSDGVILDYADEDIVIFHGYAGLFVYDKRSFKVIAQVDLKSLDAENTQGDDAYRFEVSVDGTYVFIIPANYGNEEGYIWSYGYSPVPNSYEIDGIPIGAQYGGPWAFCYEVETGKMFMCAPQVLDDVEIFKGKLDTQNCISGVENYTGFISNDCIEISEGEYGYLYCYTGMWKDICYVVSDMIYAIYDDLLEVE